MRLVHLPVADPDGFANIDPARTASLFLLIDNQGDIVLRSDPDRNDPESDRNKYTSVFNHLFMRSNKLMGKVTGIKAIEPSQQ